MTETAVPDDLMKVAREVAVGIAEGEFSPIDRLRAARYIAVALAAERERATLAERERCAAIPMQFAIPGHAVAGPERMDAIARAILARP